MCDKCNNINPCACNEPTFCGCSTKLDLLCTYYSGETLEPIGITEGMDGTTVVSKINDYLKNILQNLDISPTVIESIGNGVAVYKGLSAGIIDEFKSLVGDIGIDIIPEDDMVRFSINQDWLETIIIQTIDNNNLLPTLELRWSELENPGSPSTNPTAWREYSTPDSKWMAVKTENNGQTIRGFRGLAVPENPPTTSTWDVVKVKGEDGNPGPIGPAGADGADGVGTIGQASLKANVFIRANTQPTAPTGGTYNNSTPSGWSDGLPPANGQPAWMSTRIFTSDGLPPQQSDWTTPSLVADSSTIDYEFSSFRGTAPGTPSYPLNGAEWHNLGTEDDIWMAFRAINNGVAGVWSVVRIKGEQGPPGEVGSGYNVVSSNPIQSIAVGSDSTTSSQLSFNVPIAVYKDGLAMVSTNNSTLSDDEYRISLPASPRAGITVTKISSGTLLYTIANRTVFDSEAVTSTIEVTVGSNNAVLSTTFTILPIKTAEDNYSLSLIIDSNVVKFDAWGNLITPSTIIANALQQNYTDEVTWSSEPVGIVSGTGVYKTINTSTLFQGNNESVKIRIQTANGLFDETTIVKVFDGAPGDDGDPGTPGAPGINGTTGPSPRLLELVNGGQYENGGDFIDYAYYRTNDINEGWYTVKVVDGVRTVVTYTGGVPDTSPTGPWVKTPFQKEMSFGTVIAEQANIAGFKFRNQILESQHTAAMASCHPTPGVHLPKLQLNGLQGIIKFLDRMILDEEGITMKDNCGRPRILFQWLEPDGVPILRFLNADGSIKWEAGQGGYKEIIVYTTPEKWSLGMGAKKMTNETTPTESNVPKTWACTESDFYTVNLAYNLYQGSPVDNGSIKTLYTYTAPTPAETATASQIADNGKVFVGKSRSQYGYAQGWYLTEISIVTPLQYPELNRESIEGIFTRYVDGVGVESVTRLVTTFIKPCEADSGIE